MSTGAIIGIIVAVIVVIAIVVVASAAMRRSRLRRQFGPEYDRLAQEKGSRQADAELSARQKRVASLNIHELSPDQQASYSGDWTAVQERFVDTPAEAVGTAETLVWAVMRDRGYPTSDRNASMDALSVHHARSLEGYRQTQAVRPETATTEQLREAMIRYRALFEDLTGLREDSGAPQRDRVAEIRERAANPAAQDPAAQNYAAQDGAVTDDPAQLDQSAGAVPAEPYTADRNAAAHDQTAQETERTADTPR
jgi:hypothetical protein